MPEESSGRSGGADAASRTAGLEAARTAYRAHDWVAARDGFTQAQDAPGFGAEDRYALGNCSWWLGDLDTAVPDLQQAYRSFLAEQQPAMAALVALDVGYTLLLRGEAAPGSGWMGRGRRLLDELPEGAEHGYLVHIDFEAAFDAGDLPRALELASRTHELGRRHDDPGLVALGVMGQGLVAVRNGDLAAGVRLLDEAMVAAVSDEMDPGWAGNIYCHLIAACMEIVDLRRAAEWTEATARWCELMPGAGPFMGICRVHRAQIHHLRGQWEAAEQEAARICRGPAPFGVDTVAEAHYLRGDMRRLRGDLAGSEEAFRTAHELGRDPQPGLALLRLAQGHADVAGVSIRSALATAGEDPLARAPLLPAAVEVFLAAADVEAARAAGTELAGLAERYGTPALAGQALHAQGMLLLADGESGGALPVLHDAMRRWQQVDAQHEMARVRLTLSEAYAALGDHDAARREEAAARKEMRRLIPVSDQVGGRATRPGALTEREAEVLALVARGRTNQQIAAELVLSVRTVERHLATVYQKLGVSGRSARAAAVSFALREGLLDSGAASGSTPTPSA